MVCCKFFFLNEHPIFDDVFFLLHANNLILRTHNLLNIKKFRSNIKAENVKVVNSNFQSHQVYLNK